MKEKKKDFSISLRNNRNFLVVQQLRSHLPMQGRQVRTLVGELKIQHPTGKLSRGRQALGPRSLAPGGAGGAQSLSEHAPTGAKPACAAEPTRSHGRSSVLE